MLWKRDWSFESLSSHQRVDMACCIIGVGLDSAVLCAVEPITDYCYRYFITPPYPLNDNVSLNLLVNNANMTLKLWRIHDVLFMM
jgi:hypothetical protein